MKLTKRQLRQIIREEKRRLLREDESMESSVHNRAGAPLETAMQQMLDEGYTERNIVDRVLKQCCPSEDARYDMISGLVESLSSEDRDFLFSEFEYFPAPTDGYEYE